MKIIDGLPTLWRGAQDKHSGRACIMQYVSVLAGEEWTDKPECTNAALAGVAIHVNDNLPDDQRHLLVPYIARLVNTRDNSMPTKVAVDEAVKAYREVHMTDCDCGDSTPHKAVPEGDALVSFMLGELDTALDAYDEATGRRGVEPLSEEALRQLAEAVAA